ncbi:MAG: dihydrodipicolinate reductase [Desulfobacterales bacterium]|nr:MAG: dihydrodipicolinate reductase [Desulfobacterales bacterium]
MRTIPIMINGLPGNLAKTIAAAAADDPRFTLVPYSLTGPDIDTSAVTIGEIKIQLLKPDARQARIQQIQAAHPGLIAVDYTHPAAVNINAQFYTAHQIPFVMGTTGGDREKLAADVKNATVPAVIAPNMAKQIVGFQAMMEYAAKTFPDLFKGYRLEVRESHQAGKADTSGTAKAIVSCFNTLGVDFKVSDIEQIRDPDVQEKEWGIPKAHLGGHGWHTYTLKAEDGASFFEFTHNINGRDIYVSGTFDAVVFLHQLPADNTQRLFTMIDVMTRESQTP